MNINEQGVLVMSVREDGAKLLAPSFRVREFASKCGSDHVLVAIELLGILQHLREHFGRPVVVLSGYRSPEHNTRVGGSPNSQHMRGTAADIRIPGVDTRKVYDYLNSVINWHGGLGYYAPANGDFVHVDVRRGRTRW